MKRSQLTSEALAAWTCEALANGKTSLARQELPDSDLGSFFRALATAGVTGDVSLALVGFGADAAKLRQLAQRAGLSCITHFAADLHEAAAWRNDRKRHPIVIAYARGTVTGVNTLRHFEGPSSRDLALKLLEWALKQSAFTQTEAHKRLLEQLGLLVQNDDAFSFEQVRAFLEAWSEGSGKGAPREALPALGLMRDPNLFADANLIRERLEQNVALMDRLRDRPAGQMTAMGKRLQQSLAQAKNKVEFRALLKTFDNLQQIRRSPSADTLGAVSLDEALKVFTPPKPEPDVTAQPDGQEQDEPVTLNEKRLQRTCADALLDDREEELESNAEALSKGLRAALDEGEDGGDDEWECEIQVKGDEQTFKASLDRGFVAWVRHFCKAEAWGGLIETSVPDLKRALDDFDRPETLTLDPEHLGVGPGGELSLGTLLAGWDEDLEAQGKGQLGLAALWQRFKELRSQLLGSLEELTHFPLEWFAGKSDVRAVAEDYLKTCGRLFGLVAQHYGAMAQYDPNWAKTTLEALLALDVVQVRTTLPDGRRSSKAALLPTHPLYLWRYWRLSNLLRGLGNELNPDDRKAVIEEAGAPVQFLSVIYASPLPGNKGAAQVLPVANDLYSLATFENLRNAYNGPDGQSALVYAVERFAAAHRLHVNPLRLVLVNAPQAGALLLDLLKLLDGRKKRLVQKLRVEVRGTNVQEARLKEALLFDTREREIIEEKVASGRLELIVNREAKSLKDILAELQAQPAHLVAVFDEAPVSVRRGGAGQRLPMSPFCVRRKVAFHKRWNELRLEPVAGDPPFFEFIELIKHVEGNEGEGTPYAWPEAEALRESVDSVVSPEDFGAHWFFLADRALPEEGAMKAQRLLRRREGQRQVLLAARDYGALARLMLPVFEEDTPNLLMPVARLNELLAEGAHLIGAGLLDLVKAQEGRVDPGKVIGLMGTLLAARDFVRRHPGALLVSTDSQLARTWLRLGAQGERCDLLGVHESGGKLVVECVEVKTTKGAPRSATDEKIAGACQQVAATLAAVREGLGDTTSAEQSGRFLAAPRNEMLKEVLVQGCMGRFATESERSRWAGWLARLFGPTPELPELHGTVMDVALGSAEDKPEENITTEGVAVRLRHLNEADVERLLEPSGNGPAGGDSSRGNGGETENPTDPQPGGAPENAAARKSSISETAGSPPAPEAVSTHARATPQRLPSPPDPSEPSVSPAASELRTEELWTVTLGATKDGTPVTWPPSIRGNPHLLIVGLPGMGKTTALINLCRQLQAGGVTPIVFSYHDDIDERLAELFPDVASHDCRDLGFNPTRIVEPSPVAHVESAGQLRDIFAAIFPDLGDLQLEQLRGAIKQSYEATGWGGAHTPTRVPAFRDFLQRLRREGKPDLRTKTLLARLTELDDFGFFAAAEGEASLLDSTTPQLIRIHAVANEAVQRAYASFVLYRIYQDMFRRGRQERLTHAVVFDEAHRASRLKLLPTMAKECRKYGLALIVASQEARDFDSGLFAAIANYLVLRVTDTDARVMARNVAPSNQERRMADRLKNLPKFEALFFAEGQRLPAAVQLAAG